MDTISEHSKARLREMISMNQTSHAAHDLPLILLELVKTLESSGEGKREATQPVQYVCKFYPNEPCPLPNVHCSAPDCKVPVSLPEVEEERAAGIGKLIEECSEFIRQGERRGTPNVATGVSWLREVKAALTAYASTKDKS